MFLTKKSLCASLLLLMPFVAPSAEPAPDWKSVEPLLSAKCYSCHGGEKTKGEVDLKALASNPKVGEEFELWHRVLDTIERG